MSEVTDAASARAALQVARRERQALSTQLRSLRYAADLTVAELSRRTAARRAPPPSADASSASALEARLLAAKASSASARARVHALQAAARALRARRARPPSQHISAAMSPARRAAARAVAELDALAAFVPGQPVPARVSVSAGCVVDVFSTRAAPDAPPSVRLAPPFARVSEVMPLDPESALVGELTSWLSALDVTAIPPDPGFGMPGPDCGRPTARAMALVGLFSAALDAKERVSDHESSPFAGLQRSSGYTVRPTVAPSLYDAAARLGRAAVSGAKAVKEAVPDVGVTRGLESAFSALSATFGDVSPPEALSRTSTRSSVDMDQAERDAARRTRRTGSPPPKITSVPIYGGVSGVVLPSELAEIMTCAPTRFATSSLRLLYSTRVHGISLQSLYSKGKSVSPTILAVRDSQGSRFGCFATAPWHRGTKPTYYGTGESFCWKANATAFGCGSKSDDGATSNDGTGEVGNGMGSNPSLESSSSTKDNDGELSDSSSVLAYKWSRRNNYFQCTTSSYLAFGGGGHFALRVDDDLQHGSSGACDTFDSPCLASDQEFDCVVLELWEVESCRR